MGVRLHTPPDKIAEGRRRYVETDEHNEDIAAYLGISPSTFKSRRREWGWPARGTHWFKPQTPATEATAAEQAVYQAILKDALPEAERIRRTIECELAAIANNGAPWTTWLILGGRGAGKTRAGAEWVRAQAADPRARIALIGDTERDVRDVMIEGVSGLLGIHPDHERPEWLPTRGLVAWKNGAIAQAV